MKKLILLVLIFGCKAVGKTPSKSETAKFQSSDHFTAPIFHNLDTMPSNYKPVSFTRILKDFRQRDQSVRPTGILPLVKTNLTDSAFTKPAVIWFGHSSFLLKTPGLNILVDPIFSSHAGPLSFAMRAFKDSIHYTANDMPVIDVLIISHDHYDHLDYKTVRALKNKIRKIIVPKGVGRNFTYWGFNPAIIQETDWNQLTVISPELSIRTTASRHRSGRAFKENKSLWASYIITAGVYKIFYSGDTGYGSHFKIIGDRFGPFDLALMECGQYNKDWPASHMFPEQTAQAAAELRAVMILPVHWGKFAESTHPWNEPVKKLIVAAEHLHIPVTIPEMGESYTIGAPPLIFPWWN